MPSVKFASADADELAVPLLNSQTEEDAVEDEKAPLNLEYVAPDDEDAWTAASSDHDRGNSDAEREVKLRQPQDNGCYYDDPLWWGKTRAEIEEATELEKANGNAASRENDWKRANRYWKNALKGAIKIEDVDTERRLCLNLALGYVKRGKVDKALAHCDLIFQARLSASAPSEFLAKAHYRRAEAHRAAGEVSKAMTSYRASLNLDATNAEVRRKIAELRQVEAEQRNRERDLFHGKLATGSCGGDSQAEAHSEKAEVAHAEHVRKQKGEDGEDSSDEEEDEEGEEEEEEDDDDEEADDEDPEDAPETYAKMQAFVRSLTDNRAASRLGAMLYSGDEDGPLSEEAGCDLNVEIGDRIDFCSPGTADNAARLGVPAAGS